MTFQRFQPSAKNALESGKSGKERADVNLASKNGATPLYLAAAWERTECLIHLLDARAKVTQLNKQVEFLSGVSMNFPFLGGSNNAKMYGKLKGVPLI